MSSACTSRRPAEVVVKACHDRTLVKIRGETQSLPGCIRSARPGRGGRMGCVLWGGAGLRASASLPRGPPSVTLHCAVGPSQSAGPLSPRPQNKTVGRLVQDDAPSQRRSRTVPLEPPVVLRRSSPTSARDKPTHHPFPSPPPQLPPPRFCGPSAAVTRCTRG